ncbi:LD-carboxypeptidase [Acinetobacter nematophilus]|uniref:LD-carboxypeptidase n=1 Tax=Acinetobacter nematophilus TaxID=2994642 RepID=A0A9X3DQU6_9GAMM|nr:LD-carboxypeptidase [Acinetobacter nematophilus]MCX5466804.1 LD-carboxypeptidase [Acinetobacter nematophilus]
MHFKIVSPSACVDIESIQLAQTHLQRLGHQVSLGQHVFAQYRYLAGTIEQRVEDLKQASLDPTVDAIWCGRGGTGAAMLLPFLGEWILNKPIIGYSDTTVLLNYVAMHGGQALHAPVFQEIAVKNLDNSPISYDALKTISLLTADSNKQNLYALSALNSFTQNQVLENLQVLGGNLTVLCSLQGTPDRLALDQPSTLLIEDVGEPYYRIERAFTQLLQSIDTSQLKAVVLGDFYQCPQKNVPQSITEIVAEHLEPLKIPLYQCNWFGHGAVNRPFWLGKTGKIVDSQLII